MISCWACLPRPAPSCSSSGRSRSAGTASSWPPRSWWASGSPTGARSRRGCPPTTSSASPSGARWRAWSARACTRSSSTGTTTAGSRGRSSRSGRAGSRCTGVIVGRSSARCSRRGGACRCSARSTYRAQLDLASHRPLGELLQRGGIRAPTTCVEALQLARIGARAPAVRLLSPRFSTSRCGLWSSWCRARIRPRVGGIPARSPCLHRATGGRFFIEALRLDSFWIGSFRVGQLASVAGVLVAGAGLWWALRRPSLDATPVAAAPAKGTGRGKRGRRPPG